ncbi:uncharacterized protein LOC121982780 [Zingiber officinale]|nr:uncharacterized protein LOC121982780 [Zingiber officinale]
MDPRRLVIFTCILYLLAVPLPGTIALGGRKLAMMIEVADQIARRKLLMVGKSRMDVELNDYPPSGANNRHDPPKGPGKL